MRKRYTLILSLILLVTTTSTIHANKSIDGTDDVIIYPIPAKTNFTIALPKDYASGQIIITNMVGKEVMLIPISNQKKINVLTDELDKGIYFISIQVSSEIVFTKRIMIDK